jgi:small membrane protein
MKPIQPIQYLLVLLLIAGIIAYTRSLGSRLLDRLLVTMIGASGVVLVAMPDLSTEIAHLLGVGRGSDLVVYLGLLGLAYLFLLIYAEVRQTNQRLTQLARAVAIHHARHGPEPHPPGKG